MTKTLLQINTGINSTAATGRIAEEIGKQATASGWESYIAFGRRERKSASHKIKIGNRFGIFLHFLLTRLFDEHGFGSKTSTLRFIKKIQEIKPDIIHLHNIHGYYINIKILFNFLAKSRIPVIWTLHDCWAITGHCSHFDAIGCDRWRTECNNCPQKRNYPRSLFTDHSTSNHRQKKELFTSVKNMTIIPVSSWLGDIIKQSFLNKYPVQVIQNGIDTDLFSPQSGFIILGVANVWDDRKGLNDFISLNRQLDNAQYQIILVGLTGRQIRRLPKGIIGITRTESIAELAKLYSIADVFVNTTYEDTFPTVNLESLACGTPVITYKTGGSIESVSEDTGMVVEKGNISALCTAIQEIAQKRKSVYSENCRKRAVSLYNKENRFSDYINLYNNILCNEK
jgi:glycosyltransferase involved in cell wall biosynthesis